MSNFLKDKCQPIAYKLMTPLINLLVYMRITPNMITLIGLVLNILASISLVYMGIQNPQDLTILALYGVCLLMASFFDMVDGRLARVTNSSSRFGALFDSVLDRYSELIMFGGLCVYLGLQHNVIGVLLSFISLIGSIMVSYIRARAEGLGIECKEGLMQRPERILLIGFSTIITGIIYVFETQGQADMSNGITMSATSTMFFNGTLLFMAISTNYTAMSRLLDAKNKLNDE